MSDDPRWVALRQRIDGLDDRLGDLRTELYALIVDYRKDSSATIGWLGIELSEKRKADEKVLSEVRAISERTARIEEAFAADREDRPAKQEELREHLAAIEYKQGWRMVVPWVALAIVAGLIVGALVW